MKGNDIEWARGALLTAWNERQSGGDYSSKGMALLEGWTHATYRHVLEKALQNECRGLLQGVHAAGAASPGGELLALVQLVSNPEAKDVAHQAASFQIENFPSQMRMLVDNIEPSLAQYAAADDSPFWRYVQSTVGYAEKLAQLVAINGLARAVVSLRSTMVYRVLPGAVSVSGNSLSMDYDRITGMAIRGLQAIYEKSPNGPILAGWRDAMEHDGETAVALFEATGDLAMSKSGVEQSYGHVLDVLPSREALVLQATEVADFLKHLDAFRDRPQVTADSPEDWAASLAALGTSDRLRLAALSARKPGVSLTNRLDALLYAALHVLFFSKQDELPEDVQCDFQLLALMEMMQLNLCKVICERALELRPRSDETEENALARLVAVSMGPGFLGNLSAYVHANLDEWMEGIEHPWLNELSEQVARATRRHGEEAAQEILQGTVGHLVACAQARCGALFRANGFDDVAEAAAKDEGFELGPMASGFDRYVTPCAVIHLPTLFSSDEEERSPLLMLDGWAGRDGDVLYLAGFERPGDRSRSNSWMHLVGTAMQGGYPLADGERFSGRPDMYFLPMM